jgi:tol-pal system protein YbgF
MRRLTASLLALALVLPLAMPAPGVAQEREATLADIRQELSVLLFEMQRLRRELVTTQGAPAGLATGGSVLERVDAIESELRRLTARTEQLEFRIERIVTDGTNRIGDLEFRLVELEGGDLGALAATPPLGGETPERGLGQPAPPPGAGEAPLLAVGEQDDFDRARAALDAGDYDAAVERFAAFVETYTGGPLTAEAHFLRGRAHAGQGATTAAARAWLDAFNADPNGARAAESLMRLGQALGELGQVEEGCLMLDEVGARFPGSDMVAPAAEARRALSCP